MLRWLSRLDDDACVAGSAPRSSTSKCARLRCSPAPSPPRPSATNAVGPLVSAGTLRASGGGHVARCGPL